MKKEIAEEILSLLLSIDTPVNRVLELLNTLGDDEAKPLRKAMRKIGIDIYSDVMRPIFRQYPDLDSDDHYK